MSFNSRGAGKIHLHALIRKTGNPVSIPAARVRYICKNNGNTRCQCTCPCASRLFCSFIIARTSFFVYVLHKICWAALHFSAGACAYPLLLQAKTGPKNRGTRKGAGRMLSKSVLQQPEALTPPVRLSPPPPAGGAPSQRGPRGKKRYFFIFFLTFPGTGPIAGV